MKKNIPVINHDKYRSLVTTILERPKERQWIENNRPAIQQRIQQQVIADMTTTLLAQNPKLLQQPLPRPELFKSLHQVAKLITQAAMDGIIKKTVNDNKASADESNNKSFSNKRIFANKKWAAILAALFKANQEKAYLKKLSKLLNYLAYQDAQKAAMAASLYEANQFAEEKSPTSPEPKNSFMKFLADLPPSLLTGLHLKISLLVLKLKPGSKHPEIKDAFQKILEEYLKIDQPSVIQEAEFNDAVTAYNILIAIEESRLEKLAEEIENDIENEPISSEEVDTFSRILRLNPNQEYKMSEIEEKILEYYIENADDNRIETQIQMQLVEHTFEKLVVMANKQNQPDPIVTLNRVASPAEISAIASQTPQLSLAPK